MPMSQLELLFQSCMRERLVGSLAFFFILVLNKGGGQLKISPCMMTIVTMPLRRWWGHIWVDPPPSPGSQTSLQTLQRPLKFSPIAGKREKWVVMSRALNTVTQGPIVETFMAHVSFSCNCRISPGKIALPWFVDQSVRPVSLWMNIFFEIDHRA